MCIGFIAIIIAAIVITLVVVLPVMLVHMSQMSQSDIQTNTTY